ncbi:MAG: hypothetical protein P8X74_09055 [Reinekea sp.]|jgi:hypothetical protein
MKIKHAVFSRLVPWSRHYRAFKVLAILQLLVCIVLPVAAPDLDNAFWFLSLTLFGFWLSTYALIRLAHHYNPEAKGVSGWITHQWENILFIGWMVIAFAIAAFVVKLVLYLA